MLLFSCGSWISRPRGDEREGRSLRHPCGDVRHAWLVGLQLCSSTMGHARAEGWWCGSGEVALPSKSGRAALRSSRPCRQTTNGPVLQALGPGKCWRSLAPELRSEERVRRRDARIPEARTENIHAPPSHPTTQEKQCMATALSSLAQHDGPTAAGGAVPPAGITKQRAGWSTGLPPAPMAADGHAAENGQVPPPWR
jgi:hypothetical protein